MNKLTDFFKILSDETRFRIVILLVKQELCVCEICGVLELSQPKVSKHLAKLRDKGFVKDERKDQFVFYSLKIEDDLLKNFIMNIEDNIDKYPQLSMDKKRLVHKETYLSQCKMNSAKSLQ